MTAQTLPYATPAGFRLGVGQTVALFADALRRLRAAKLFWVALALSVLFAAALGILGINSAGLTVPFYGQIETPLFSTRTIPEPDFYKGLFALIGVNLWLAWAAVILAIISTADLVPGLVADGSVDLYVTRPLGRVQLFLTRYATGLLFVAAQAVCFAATAALVFGLRAGVWVPAVFWAVPMVVLMFSYLYCVSALVGLLTGSSVAAVLVALLFWVLLFAVDTTDQVLLTQREQARATVAFREGVVERSEALAARFAGAGRAVRDQQSANVAVAREQLAAARTSAASWGRAHRAVLWLKAPLPKTAETVTAMQGRMLEQGDIAGFEEQVRQGEFDRARRRAEGRADDDGLTGDARRTYVEAAVAEEAGESQAADLYADRPAWWSLGTGAAFEAAVLLLCCRLFARRDL